MGLRLEPIGPLPASTYWRRRAVSLAVLLAVVLLLVRACSGGDDPPDESLTSAPSVAPSQSAGASPGPVPGPTPTPSPTPSPTPTPTPTPTRSPAPTADCAEGAVRLTPATDAASYPLSATARLSVTITNTSTVPCRLGLGQGSLELSVRSGDDRIWSSDDCSPGGDAGPETLGAGAEEVVRLSWSLTRSAPGCPSGRPALEAGTYTLTGRAAAFVSAPVAFALTSG